MEWMFQALALVALSSHLTPEKIVRIETLLTPPFAGKNLEQLEKSYQTTVQEQTFADLMLLYAPENAKHVRITYPAFIPSDGRPGKDRGYGLHVVKRLTLPLGAGREKVVYVNEQWPESRVSGGLYFPDEIRVQTLVFDGERRVEGSEKNYLFDSIRLAWGPGQEIRIARRTRYTHDDRTGKNHLKQMRVPVSAPLSCMACHHSPSIFAGDFLAPGEMPNHEAIVQDSYFDKPLEETRGFKSYLDYLSEKKASPEFIKAAREALLDPAKSFEVPGIIAALREETTHTPEWLSDDGGLPYGAEPVLWRNRKGVYQGSHGEWLIDAAEQLFDNQYLWWEPVVVVPRLDY